jgi:1,2-diacylglycerol 3-alpha-glucosyltransferase
MRIGFFTDSYTPQIHGVATALNMLVPALEALGHEVHIFAPKMGSYVDQRPRVYRFPSIRYIKQPPYWIATPISPQVFSRIPRLGLDIVHFHTPATLGAMAVQVARLQGIPLVQTYHTMIPEYLHYFGPVGKTTFALRAALWYARSACNLCDHIIAPSEKVRRALLQYGVFRPVTVIPNGLRLDGFVTAEKGYLRGRLGLRTDEPIVLFVGRLGAEKRPEVMLRSFVHLNRRLPEAHLVFAGDGYARRSLEGMASDLGIGPRTHFLGNVPYEQMPKVYADASVYVSTSVSEVHPMVVIEALASGVPIVAAPDEALEGTVVHGVNGYFATDEEDFALKMEWVLRSEELRSQMAEASRQMGRHFAVETQAARVVEVYQEALRARAQRRAQESAA